MSANVFGILLLLLLSQTVCHADDDDIEEYTIIQESTDVPRSTDIQEFTIIQEFTDVPESTDIPESGDVQEYLDTYFDLQTNETYQGFPVISGRSVNSLSFRGGFCSCRNGGCSCCVGIRIKRFNFEAEGCARIYYDSQASAMTAVLTINNRSILGTYIRLKSLPSICGSVPILPVKFCLKVAKFNYESRKVNICINLETRVFRIPILVLHFPCLRL